MSYTQILEPNGELTYVLHSGVQFRQPALAPDNLALPAAQDAESTIDALSTLIEFYDQTHEDRMLSPIGKQSRIEPKQLGFVEVLANRWAALDNHEAALDEAQAAMLAVPRLDPTHAAMATEDREIRDWLRTQPLDEVAQALQDPANDRLKIAVLRSPIPQSDNVVKVARAAWESDRRAADPAAAARIEAGRKTLQWSRRAVMQVAGLANIRVLKSLERDRILRQVVGSTNPVTAKGYGVFGFEAREVATLRQRLQYEKAR